MSSESNIQYRGNCQCCGRIQAVINSAGAQRMAKHGYEVKDRGNYGYFAGTCQGIRFQPMQASRAVTDQLVATAREDAIKHDQRAADLKAGKVFPSQIRGRYNHERRDYDMKPFEEGDEWEKRSAVKSAIHSEECRASGARSWADQMEKLVNAVHGTALIEVDRDAGPAPIHYGDKRKNEAGDELEATAVYRGMVHWRSPRGDKVRTGRMSTRSWRLMAEVAKAEA